MPIKTIHSKAYRALIRRLRERRIELGLTQLDVATKVNHSRTWLQKVESAELRIDFLQTIDLLRLLKIDVDDAVRLVEEGAP
jgi:transcriptional regulator with XRE-family HTH domain